MKTTLTKTHFIYTTVLVVLIGFLGSAAFRGKSEAAMPVIQAGVDKSGNPICINKSQVYLFTKNDSDRRILFHFHDPGARDGFSVVKKVFASKKAMEEYWEVLVKQW